MSIFEYDKEEEERKLRKAEYEAGIKVGREAGIKVGIKVGREAGLKVGREAGLKEGIQEIVQNMLRAGKTPEKIARYTGCEIQELEKIAEALQTDEAVIQEWTSSKS